MDTPEMDKLAMDKLAMGGAATNGAATNSTGTSTAATNAAASDRTGLDRDAIDRSDASALADLQMHWDEAYEIGLDGHIWWARFWHAPDQLRAHTSTELRELIRADYAYRQRMPARYRRRAEIVPAGDEDDSYEDAYESELDTHGGVSTPAAPPPGPPDYTGLRGERMSI